MLRWPYKGLFLPMDFRAKGWSLSDHSQLEHVSQPLRGLADDAIGHRLIFRKDSKDVIAARHNHGLLFLCE